MEAQDTMGKCFRTVKGPVGALIRHALDIGWVFTSPFCVSAKGKVHDLREVSPDWIRDEVRKAAEDRAWTRTLETRRDAKGLEATPDWLPVTRALATIRTEQGLARAAFAETLVK